MRRLIAFFSPSSNRLQVGLCALCTALLTCRAMAQDDLSLVDAARRDDLPALKAALQKNADVDAAGPDGMTALHWAACHDNLPAVDALLQAGASAAASNRYQVTPLFFACQNGSSQIIKRLLDSGADVNAVRIGGETALMTAARTGRPDAVRLLIARGARLDDTEWHGQTALMWAAADGHAEAVRVLLNAGADPDVRLKSGFTAWFFAAREGRLDVIRTMLDAGFDINAAMQPEKTGGRAPRRGMSALMLAVENGHFELAAWLLEKGADPNDQRSGYTALHALTWVRKPNRGDGPDGEPPPPIDGPMTSLDFVRRFAEAGGDVNARLKRGPSGRGKLNFRGATPFFMAADTADLPLLKLLLQLGADPDIPNADNCIPLLAAAGIGTYAPGEEAGTEDEAMACVRFLLDLGQDINHVDNNGETVMHGAAYASWPRMAQLLADHGADVRVWHKTNKYGWTPLLIAQGHRAGNFKPAPATIKAISRIMQQRGVQPTDAQPFRSGDEYASPEKNKTKNKSNNKN